MNRETIIKYVRDRKGKPRGVIVATKVEETRYSIGWSLCNPADSFNKRMGLQIAIGRATALADLMEMPPSLHSHLGDMVKRANRYFKGCVCK